MLLTGVGGDHLFTPPFALLRTALRTEPVRALRRIRQASLQNRWRLRDVLASARPVDYATWLRRCKDTLDRTPSHGMHALDWDSPPRLPAWATPSAREAVVSALDAAARNAAPLSTNRGQHAGLYMIHHGTRVARVLNEGALHHHAIRFEHPYFDDRLIESCMQIRPLDRSDPWNFKPVVKSAMRGVIDPALQARQDKGAGSLDKYAGLSENRERIVEMIERSRLVEMGLVDASRLRAEIDGAPQIAVLTEQLDATLAVEKWMATT
ncbi:asparagine synthase-related protein [Rhodococcoides kroppenstedtii]|uniref:asparagine synthase-related protein n=1 Tax=Rhodococcoides kroppenstedtii TaxID=293050 RepID=UPI0036371151